MTRFLVLTACAMALPIGAAAFERVEDRDTFVDLVSDRDLKRFGITLQVSENGAIQGRAFGQDVTGQWRWSNGYFCRDLYYGSRDLGPNCQTVEIKGETMRFTSDQGAGMSANLKLD